MFVCLCNGLRERDVRRAVDGGAATVGEAFDSLACEPRCATCVPQIRTLIAAHREPALVGAGAAGAGSER